MAEQRERGRKRGPGDDQAEAVRRLTTASDDPVRDIAKMRRHRLTFDDIAEHFGVTSDAAAAAYQELIEAQPELDADDSRTEELRLVDDAVRHLLTIARGKDTSARTAVEAWNSIRGWAEHKARLLGLAAPAAKPAAQVSRLEAIRAARRA